MYNYGGYYLAEGDVKLLNTTQEPIILGEFPYRAGFQSGPPAVKNLTSSGCQSWTQLGQFPPSELTLRGGFNAGLSLVMRCRQRRPSQL